MFRWISIKVQGKLQTQGITVRMHSYGQVYSYRSHHFFIRLERPWVQDPTTSHHLPRSDPGPLPLSSINVFVSQLASLSLSLHLFPFSLFSAQHQERPLWNMSQIVLFLHSNSSLSPPLTIWVLTRPKGPGSMTLPTTPPVTLPLPDSPPGTLAFILLFTDLPDTLLCVKMLPSQWDGPSLL